MDLGSLELEVDTGDSLPAMVVIDLDTAGDTAIEDEEDERLGLLRARSCNSASFWLA